VKTVLFKSVNTIIF